MTLIDLAGWVAAGATMIAAIMTAANLGSRITGWGFAVFLLGAVAWIIVAIGTGQRTLLLSNAFLAVVDIVGIWRWLGRRAALDDGARRAERRTKRTKSPLFRLASLENAVIRDPNGESIATSVGAMAECDSGTISYVMARPTSSENGEGSYVAIPWDWLSPEDGHLRLQDDCSLDRLAPVEAKAWPAIAPRPDGPAGSTDARLVVTGNYPKSTPAADQADPSIAPDAPDQGS